MNENTWEMDLNMINIKTNAIYCAVFVVCSTLFGLLSCHEKNNHDVATEIAVSLETNKPTISKNSKLDYPDTTHPDTTDSFWEFNNNLSINGVSYYKKEVSKGRWQWIEDTVANQAIADYNNRKRELMQALQSRILTKKERAEVESHGRDLNIYSMEVYSEDDKQRELNEALLQQFRLRNAKK